MPFSDRCYTLHSTSLWTVICATLGVGLIAVSTVAMPPGDDTLAWPGAVFLLVAGVLRIRAYCAQLAVQVRQAEERWRDALEVGREIGRAEAGGATLHRLN